MLTPLLFCLFQAAAAPARDSGHVGARDSVRGDYASEALRRLVADAAAENRRVPPTLRGYRARMESELSLLVQRPEGEEGVVSVEQVASAVRWERGGAFEQRVVGYRAQVAGPVPSALSFVRQSWAVPVLYGNRIALFFGLDPAEEARRASKGKKPRVSDTLLAVHPLAEDRDEVYRYSGGDTVVTLRSGGRAIPVVRVRVEPRPRVAALKTRTLAFTGELELDAERRQLVRMRGRFLVTGGRHGLAERAVEGTIQSAAYVELVNAEVDGAYWLPAYQRIEGQVAMPLVGAGRTAFRVLSRFRDYELDVVPAPAPTLAAADSGVPNEIGAGGADGALAAESAAAAGSGAARDTMAARPHRLSLAPRDSLERFAGWARALGDETSDTRAGDFADVAPASWRPPPDPWVALRAERLSDVFRFNRVEGAFTGAAIAAGLGARAPGVSLRATAGWAWAERTARGRAGVELRRGRWAYGAIAGRGLDVTNDFLTPFDSAAPLAALLGAQDDYDYVDRRFASLAAARLLGASRSTVVRAEAGVASDRGEVRRVSQGLFPVSGGFRENRGVTPGRYARAALTVDHDENVTSGFVRPGVGWRLSYTLGAGDLDWQRVEGRVVARATRGELTYAARLEAGLVASAAPPPQQLFELGGTQRLPGYDYKEFAGDRAADAGLLVMRALPLWRMPLRVFRTIYLPAPAPALSASIESGWVGASSDAARTAVRLLGERVDPSTGALVPISHPTDGVRTGVELGVRLFGGALGFGVGRAVDHAARWRGVVTIGQEW